MPPPSSYLNEVRTLELGMLRVFASFAPVVVSLLAHEPYEVNNHGHRDEGLDDDDDPLPFVA